jgi:hypothetical protein
MTVDDVERRQETATVVGRKGEVTGIRTAMLDLTEVIDSRRQVEFQAGLLEQVRDAIVTVHKWLHCTRGSR